MLRHRSLKEARALNCLSTTSTKVLSRRLSVTSQHYQRETPPTSSAVSPRWLSITKARIGRCITFGMSVQLVDDAGSILRELSADWRNLAVGSEGYLTDKRRVGLHRHAIVWGEQDTMGHVNNVMYVRYAESGRCNWTRNIGEHFDLPNRKQWQDLLSSRNIGLILKSITVDFKFPMTWPDRISVYHKLRNEPTASSQTVVLDVVIVSEVKQRPAARCLEDVVVYDYVQSKKTTLAPFMLKQFREIWRLQELAREENLAKVRAIEARVRQLEQSSWDRPDAREDFGSAA